MNYRYHIITFASRWDSYWSLVDTHNLLGIINSFDEISAVLLVLEKLTRMYPNIEFFAVKFNDVDSKVYNLETLKGQE